MNNGKIAFPWRAVHSDNRTEVRISQHRCRKIDGKGSW